MTGTARRNQVEEGLNDNAQLWEVSEVRDGLDDASADGLNQIDQALARIDAGDYGLCSSCANPIGKPRLEALPYVTLCIDCAEAADELDK